MSRDLTATQLRVVEAIRVLTAERGYPPSQRDIAARLRLQSVSTVNVHLVNLREAGVITMDDQIARSVRVITDQPTLGAD